MALFCAPIGQDSVSLLMFPFLSHIYVFSCEMSLVCHLKKIQRFIFLPLLFSGYCRPPDPHPVSFVCGGCNQSSSRLFYVVFVSFYVCVNAVLHAPFLPLFLTHRVCQSHARPYAWLLVFLLSRPFFGVLQLSIISIIIIIIIID